MLSNLLKEKCQKLELSSRKAAEQVGVSHPTILRALQGDIVDVDTLIKLSDWLKVKPSTLLNSWATSNEALADKVAVVLERHPGLRDVFSRALEALVEENVDPALIDDIVAYAAFKLEIYPRQAAKQ